MLDLDSGTESTNIFTDRVYKNGMSGFIWFSKLNQKRCSAVFGVITTEASKTGTVNINNNNNMDQNGLKTISNKGPSEGPPLYN